MTSPPALNPQSFSVPFHLTGAVETVLESWRSGDKLGRLWRRDASLWTGSDEAHWLGWLDAPVRADRSLYQEVMRESRDSGFSDVLLLGMGGSSLCPALFAQAFGPRTSFPKLTVLDSVDPAEVTRVADALDFERTLVVVSSKSGSTLETRILTDYFLDRVRERVGKDASGRQFVAITDPGSGLEQTAREMGFRRVYAGEPDIGGRFSAFSAFGLVPMALMGIEVGKFLDRTRPMVEACGSGASALASPGVLLGVILGTLAGHGKNKITFVASRSIPNLALWLEQLLAESTGKRGVGLIPVTDEELSADSETYGQDRAFVQLRLESDSGERSDGWFEQLEETGQPTVRIRIPDVLSIGQELFRWEIATAVAGAVLGVNPFDQPDVEASKQITRRLMADYERTGDLPAETPTCQTRACRVFASGILPSEPTLEGSMQAFAASIPRHGYCAILVYAPETASIRAALGRLRARIRRATGVATTLGFGPRYLHSSGQLHKGGPDSGAFLILVASDAEELPVPGHAYSFGVVKAAQARGDAHALREKGRRVLRIEFADSFDRGIGLLGRALATTDV